METETKRLGPLLFVLWVVGVLYFLGIVVIALGIDNAAPNPLGTPTPMPLPPACYPPC